MAGWPIGSASTRLKCRWILFGALCITAFLCVLSANLGEDALYRELTRSAHLWTRFTRWQLSPTYGRIFAVLNIDPMNHHLEKVERLETKLYESGDLVSLTFLVPNLNARQSQVRDQLSAIAKNHPDQLNEARFPSSDTVQTLCRPEFVQLLQTCFGCDITNRVPWADLWRLGGSRENIRCRLPDRSVVNIDSCYKWLNDSIGEGWSVGALSLSDRPGHSMIVVTRKKREAEQ
jgi:hypothetical protein